MTPVMQTVFGQRSGNCMQAAVASLLDLPLETVPHFFDQVDVEDVHAARIGWEKFAEFFASFGTVMSMHRGEGAFAFPHIATGVSPRGIHHAVICDGFQLLHDPHPEGGGVVVETRYDLVVEDPTKLHLLEAIRTHRGSL